jgi:hypothetical protein
MGSPDPFLSALKDVGLSVVRLPRPNLGPLGVLVKEGNRLTYTGKLQELTISEESAPKVTTNQDAVGISGGSTRALDVSLGVSLLKGWLGAMGSKNIGIESSFKNASSLKFTFPEVLVDTVSSIGIDIYLARSSINPDARQLTKLFEEKRVYLITLAAKTRRLSVEAQSDMQGGAALDVPLLQDVVGGTVKVSASQGATNVVTYEGPTPVYFGFQALRLFYNEGRYQGWKPMKPGDAAILSGHGGNPRQKRRVWFMWNAPFTPVDNAPESKAGE